MKETIQEPSELLTVKEAVQLCKISRVTLKSWMDKEMISFIKMGNRVLFRKSQLIEDLKKFETPARN